MDTSAIINIMARADSTSSAPTPSTPAQQFLALVSDPFKSQLQGQAFLSALGISVGFTAIIAIIFCFIRPYNTVVYAPRVRYADQKHAPPTLGKSPWAWVTPVITTKEEMLVEKVGMDAAVFIRFTAMLRNMFLVLTVVGCGVLIPVYLIGGAQFTKGQPGLSTFMKMTPTFLVGLSFWGIVVAAWLINLTVCFFLWWNYKAITRLRRHYFQSPEYLQSLHSRTLMVTELPKSMMTDEGVVRIVDEVKQAGVLPKGSVGRNVKGLPDLIEEHEELVRQLEAVLSKYLKNPDKLPSNRPTCKPSKKDPEYVANKGLGNVDAIDYLTRRVQHLEKQINHTRANMDQRNAMPYGFASYENVEEAHGVAYAARKKHPHGATIRQAPRPADIIWKNLVLTPRNRKARSFMNNVWVSVLTLIWIGPNALIAIFLSNLNNLGLVWPAFNDQLHKNPKLWAVVQGVLAPTLTSLVYIFLPKIFRRLAMQAGDTTKTSRDRHVLSRLYAFFVFNNLIVFSVFGAVWQFIAAIINAKEQNKDILEAIKEGNVWNKIMIALCNVAPFWSSYLAFRTVSAALDLSQLANFAVGFFKRKFLSPTPREVIEFSAPPPFDYASYYNYFLFYSTVAITFSTIQPIVLPVTAFYFVLDSWLKKYLIMYVFTTKTESGGRFWRVLFNRMLFSILLCDVVVALMVYAKHEGTGNSWIAMLGCLAPLPFLIWTFKFFCSRAYDDQCEYYSKGLLTPEQLLDDNKSTRSSNTIAVRFGHPAMFKPLMTPMVHAKAQHMLAKVYNGRLYEEEDDYDVLADTYSETYSMRHIRKGSRALLQAQKEKKSSPFEFIAESDLDFENFKNRSDFRGEHGGEGELFGKPDDAASRTGTPVGGISGSGNRNSSLPRFTSPPPRPGSGQYTRPTALSRDSDRTFVSTSGAYGQGGYPGQPGYLPPTLRSYSAESGMNVSGQDVHLLAAAAPIGQDPISRQTTPGDYRR